MTQSHRPGHHRNRNDNDRDNDRNRGDNDAYIDNRIYEKLDGRCHPTTERMGALTLPSKTNWHHWKDCDHMAEHGCNLLVCEQSQNEWSTCSLHAEAERPTNCTADNAFHSFWAAGCCRHVARDHGGNPQDGRGDHGGNHQDGASTPTAVGAPGIEKRPLDSAAKEDALVRSWEVIICFMVLLMIGSLLLLLVGGAWRRRRLLAKAECVCDTECPTTQGAPNPSTDVSLPSCGPEWQSGSVPADVVGHMQQASTMSAATPTVFNGALERLAKCGATEHWLIGAGDVELQHTIGQGAFGFVHKGLLFGYTPVAVKVPHGPWAQKADDTFAQEVQILRRLRHPNIVLFLGAVLMENLSLWIVLEWVDGRTLLEFLSSDRGIESTPLLRDTALGLQYLHSCVPPVLHRDLKPSNVLVETVREPLVAKISDFGLSLVLHEDEKLRADTVRYMAPEVKMGMKYGTPSDVYSFGIMLADYLMIMEAAAHVATSLKDLRCLAVRCHSAVAANRPLVTDVLEVFDTRMELSTRGCWSKEHVPQGWSDLPSLPGSDASLPQAAPVSQLSRITAVSDFGGSTGDSSMTRAKCGGSEDDGEPLGLTSVSMSIAECNEDQESEAFASV